jgi:hypothetical protein
MIRFANANISGLLRGAAVAAVLAAVSAAAVVGVSGSTDASTLTITPKPRIIDARALSTLSSLPQLSAVKGAAIGPAYGEMDEDCARIEGQTTLICRR